MNTTFKSFKVTLFVFGCTTVKVSYRPLSHGAVTVNAGTVVKFTGLLVHTVVAIPTVLDVVKHSLRVRDPSARLGQSSA